MTRAINDALAELARADPQHVAAMATVPLQHPELAVAEIERAHGELGMRSVQIGTHVGDMDLDDATIMPFWEAVQRLGMAVFIHPHQKKPVAQRLRRYHLHNILGHPIETTIAAASIIFGGVLDRFPDLKICFAHGGGLVPWLRGRWRHAHGARSETHDSGAERPFDEYFRRIYVDSVIHDEAALRYLIEVLGADHVLFGTDYPASMGNWQQAKTIGAMRGVSSEDNSKVLGGNALRLVGAA